MRYSFLLVMMLSGCSFHKGYVKGYTVADKLLRDQKVSMYDAGFVKGIMDRAKLYQLEEKRNKF
jgi:hypothetical protein